jgi:hypothetical protein
MSIKMVLRKSRNEDWMLIMIRVILGHNKVLRRSIGFGQIEVQHFPRRSKHQSRPDTGFRQGMGASAFGSRHYHNNVTQEFGHFHFIPLIFLPDNISQV